MSSKTESLTIAQAAHRALLSIGRPASIKEIYLAVLELKLYTFDTPTPEHVLRTEIRRKTEGVVRVDSRDEILFKLAGDEIYEAMKESSKRRPVIGMKRIQRAVDKKAVIEMLTSDSAGVFNEIWRVLLFAAALGCKHNRREPLGAVDSGDAIRQDSFGNSPVWPGILHLMGLVESGSAELLRGSEEAENESIKIFEEYANGGLALLREKLEAGSYSLDALLDYVHAEITSAEKPRIDLDLTI